MTFSLILIDFNMPGISGNETISTIKSKYKQVNELREQNNEAPLKRPFCCMFVESNAKTIQQFMYDEEQPEYFMEKPIH